LSIR
jgi:hypothetical protein